MMFGVLERWFGATCLGFTKRRFLARSTSIHALVQNETDKRSASEKEIRTAISYSVPEKEYSHSHFSTLPLHTHTHIRANGINLKRISSAVFYPLRFKDWKCVRLPLAFDTRYYARLATYVTDFFFMKSPPLPVSPVAIDFTDLYV